MRGWKLGGDKNQHDDADIVFGGQTRCLFPSLFVMCAELKPLDWCRRRTRCGEVPSPLPSIAASFSLTVPLPVFPFHTDFVLGLVPP